MSSMHAFAHNSSSDSSSSDEAGEGDFGDFNPRKRRRTTRDPKESAALGVFGSESEDEDRPGQKWKRRNLRGKGMAFVGSGQKLEDDEEEEEEGEEDGKFEMPSGVKAEAEEEEDEEETAESSGGLGLGMAPRGLGWQSPAGPSSTSKKPPIQFSRSTPLGKGFVPSSATVPILKDTDDEVSTPRISRPSAFSTPNTNGKSKGKAPGINAGSFAARMMAKMGYKEGEGLGKEGTGRSAVIEVQLRPQGVGLGAVREKSKQEIEEEKRQAKIKGVKYDGGSSDEERKKRKARKAKVGSESGSGVSTPRRVQKPKYRTVEELQKAAPGLQIPEAFAPILDMTGPGQKLLTSTSGLLTPTNGGFVTAEQGENMKLAKRAQNDLTSFVEEWKNLEERKAYVEMSIVQQEQELEEEEREYNRMKAFADTVSSISQAVSDMQWDPVFAALKSASAILDTHSDNDSAKQTPDLADVAVAAVHPFLRQAVEGWSPLDDPKLNGFASQLYEIRHILGATFDQTPGSQSYITNNGTHRIHAKSTTTYESMMYKIIFPKLVSAINQSWDAHNPAPLLNLLLPWEELLPPFVKSQLFDQVIVTKLNTAISSWNPRRSHSSKDLPHLWLFPWLQYLPANHADPSSSHGLVSDVKRKFRKLVDSWDFRKGVIPGFSSWREVLNPSSKTDHWTPLIMNHVLPSMGSFLSNEKYFIINPQDQEPYMAALIGVLAWEPILSTKIIGQVIADRIFPAWHSVLHQWLTEVGPNQEIGQWFEWWRDEALPASIRELQIIQDEFDKGEAMINHALDLGDRAATELPIPSSHLPHHHHSKQATSRKSSPPAPAASAPSTKPTVIEEPTIRDALESWCIDNDLQFLPEKRIMHAAGPLYRVTAAGNGKNGVLLYFRGERVVAVQRKSGAGATAAAGEEGKEREWKEIEIQWATEEGRDVLLGMAFWGVK